MLYSMTGFGSTEVESDKYRIKVEVKTLNSKFLDLSLKLPRELADKELEVKSLVGQHLKRGKVNLAVELIPLTMEEPTVKINDLLFNIYYQKFQEMAERVSANPKDLFRLALHSPDVISTDEKPADIDWSTIENTLVGALSQCNDFRKQEGSVLMGELSNYVAAIKKGLTEVAAQDPIRIKQIRERISSNLKDIEEKVQIDRNRFEQELIYYTEKLDITEEKVRLGKHLDYFVEVMKDSDAQGKKLGFISQEIGREINTIGSKANDAVIQRAVVSMKDELEKIKEQLLNIL